MAARADSLYHMDRKEISYPLGLHLAYIGLQCASPHRPSYGSGQF